MNIALAILAFANVFCAMFEFAAGKNGAGIFNTAVALYLAGVIIYRNLPR